MTSTSSKETGLRLKTAAESAIRSIGLGYDVTQDLRLKYCKQGERLIAVDDDQVRDVVIPGTGGILVQNVPKSINCDKGERMRFSSDVLSFQQMSEQFNHEVSLSGKIPTGHFNAAFELTGSWQKDATDTKAFALDGVLITLYSIALEKSHIALCDHVKKAVPSSWDPAALARFIEKFGTHIIVGVKMGGKDVVYVKQQHTSVLRPDEVQEKLKNVADKRFNSRSGQYNSSPKEVRAREPLERTDYGQISVDSSKEDIILFWRRRGGSGRSIDHHVWCQTVQLEPDVISMSFIPILSLLSGLDGSGFLTHAINLYLRYKPPMEELHQFLEFQLPKQWAPVFGELAVGPETKPQNGASLQFSFMGPRLYVNTNLSYIRIDYQKFRRMENLDFIERVVKQNQGWKLHQQTNNHEFPSNFKQLRCRCLSSHNEHILVSQTPP